MSLKRPVFLLSMLIPLVLSSCSSRLNEYPSLVDKGPLPLSASNPYVGSNLFLADEFSRSDDLFNFLKGRGAPSAIEILESGLDRPAMRMFYTRDKQLYIAELEDSQIARIWIVRGPFAINRQEYKRLPKGGSLGSDEPVFVFEGRQFRFIEPPSAPPTIIALKAPQPPKPRIKTAGKSKVIKAQGDTVTGEMKSGDSTATGGSVDSGPATNLDQQALAMAGRHMEKDADGNLVHTVKKSGQTMKQIVEWYAGSGENADEIASKNGVKTTDPLPVGKKVVIPAVLVRQTKPMP